MRHIHMSLDMSHDMSLDVSLVTSELEDTKEKIMKAQMKHIKNIIEGEDHMIPGKDIILDHK